MSRGYRVEDVTLVASIEHWDLGLGESQVIAHSVGGARWAVLDDRAARRCAVAHGVPVIGTLGLVLRAKKNRQIDSARSVVEKLMTAGMFLDHEFLDGVLASIGEWSARTHVPSPPSLTASGRQAISDHPFVSEIMRRRGD